MTADRLPVASGEAVATDDDALGANPIALVFGHVVQSRLEALFRPGERVLDVGCGTGKAALLLASRGVRVVGIDPSPEAIDVARRKAAAGGLDPAICRFEVLAPEALSAAGARFDGAYSSAGALNRADLAAAGRALATALRPGAPVLLDMLGPWPLPATVRRALTAVGEARRGRDPAVARFPAYRTMGDARRALGPMFAWTDAYALGVVLPGLEHQAWVARHPQAFALLAALERAGRRWPVLRHLGDRIVLEGRRRE